MRKAPNAVNIREQGKRERRKEGRWKEQLISEHCFNCGNMQDYTNQFNVKYKKKNQFGGRKVARQGTTLGHKSGQAVCPPCPKASAANALFIVRQH